MSKDAVGSFSPPASCSEEELVPFDADAESQHDNERESLQHTLAMADGLTDHG
jgi:hypothetical protein